MRHIELVVNNCNSVTVTSILRVTAVANSVRNQKDQTWNFIQRGVWTLIEANLGIICACLIVLRQPMARFFSKIFGTTKAGTSGGYRSGYNGSGAALATIGSTKRGIRSPSNRQHVKLEDTIDYDDTTADDDERTRMTYRLATLARRGAPDTARNSDERQIVSANDSDKGAIWPFEKELGITKQVDIQVESHRR